MELKQRERHYKAGVLAVKNNRSGLTGNGEYPNPVLSY
nr:MAG TPA: hypothetical protein [Caudoviricetes sp.]